jgi:adenylate cyclase
MTGRFTATRASLAVAVLIAAVRLLTPAPLEMLDLKALDLRYRLRGATAAGSEVVIIGIDETSLAKIGRWPWPRSRLAMLIDELTEAGAAVVGLDIMFDQPDHSIDVASLETAVAAAPDQAATDLMARLRLDLDNDARLAAALRRSGRVVLGHFFELGRPKDPPSRLDALRAELSVRATGGASVERGERFETASRAYLATPVLAGAAAGAGHVNFLVDGDGIYRRVPLAVRVGDRLAPALSLEMLRVSLGGAAASVTLAPDGVQALRIGTLAPPVDGGGRLWVNYLGPSPAFPHLAAVDVLEGRVPAAALAGKLALVGFTATGFDKIATPFAPVAPGVELQAMVLDNMLHGGSLVRPWWLVPAEAALIVVLGIVLGMALRRLGTPAALLTALGVALLCAWGGQRLFENARLAVGGAYVLGAVFCCTLAGAVARAISEEREKRWIRNAFRHYLNPEVTEILARTPESLRLGGERREITILFVDVRDFTGISETLSPEVLGELLNNFLGAMTDVVFSHDGLLDKYIGDAVMAFWGAPVPAQNNAARCCRAALDMTAALGTLRERWQPLGRPLLQIGIGINTGEAAVGNFGSAQRFNYTAVGDDVNLASRLEGLNKQYATEVLITERTREAIGDEFITREIDQVLVKGRSQPVVVHELLGRRAEDQDGRLAARAAAFGAALGAFRREAWAEAIDCLRALKERYPEDRAAAAFLNRCHGRAAAAT